MKFSDLYLNALLCVFKTSPVVLYFILTRSFVQGALVDWGLLQIQLCNFSIVSFEIILPFILLSVSIHDISSNLVYITYLLYFYFPILLLIDIFDTQNSLGYDLSEPRLNRTKECDFELFSFLKSGVSIIFVKIVCWKYFMSFLISNFPEFLFWHDLENIFLVCSIEFITKLPYYNLPLIISVCSFRLSPYILFLIMQLSNKMLYYWLILSQNVSLPLFSLLF